MIAVAESLLAGVSSRGTSLIIKEARNWKKNKREHRFVGVEAMNDHL